MNSSDPNDAGNAASYHTGKPCVEPGCTNPAGTAWSPFWCQPCNAIRIARITGNLDEMAAGRDRDGQRLNESRR